MRVYKCRWSTTHSHFKYQLYVTYMYIYGNILTTKTVNKSKIKIAQNHFRIPEIHITLRNEDVATTRLTQTCSVTYEWVHLIHMLKAIKSYYKSMYKIVLLHRSLLLVAAYFISCTKISQCGAMEFLLLLSICRILNCMYLELFVARTEILTLCLYNSNDDRLNIPSGNDLLLIRHQAFIQKNIEQAEYCWMKFDSNINISEHIHTVICWKGPCILSLSRVNYIVNRVCIWRMPRWILPRRGVGFKV